MLVLDQSPESSIVLDGLLEHRQRASLETHTLRVNEAAYKNHTTLNSSRETDTLETILKTLSMRLFKGDKSVRAPITVSNHSQDQQSDVEMQTTIRN